MRLRVLMLSVLGTTGAAMGQTQSTPRPPAATAERQAADRAPQTTAQRPQAASGPQQERTARFGSDEPAPPVDPAALLRQNGNSLLKASLAAGPQASAYQAQLKDVSYTAVPMPEPKVIKRHDLVTIIVREESQYSSEGNAETTREANLEAAITEFVKLKLNNLELEGGAIGPVPPSIAMNGTREFTGEGTVDRADRFTARITAEVLDVKPNGTLVLQARKRIRTDDEEQVFTLSGTCRAEDITADNTILSTALHDQELTKTHKGTVRNATRRGWGGKLLDAISPF
jgi:flagellar L-ring protein precursor FlgH